MNAERELRRLTDAEKQHAAALGVALAVELARLDEGELMALANWIRGGVAVRGPHGGTAVAAFVRLIEADQERRRRNELLVGLEVDDLDDEGALLTELPPDYFDGWEGS